MDAALIAGMASTALFAAGNLPMLAKAARTHDLSSYSPAFLVIANLGNAIHTVYVLSLPPGPIWALHAFYALAMALMLAWYIRFARKPRAAAPEGVQQ
ncbi:hypothetical protein [Sinomonas halotolerans]|uniref:PQ-loop repeat-containing protein n=1 Tax=Sinomonas halotolerans TaxID=1644133 RepID=A0ABU9WVX6_9MICC